MADSKKDAALIKIKSGLLDIIGTIDEVLSKGPSITASRPSNVYGPTAKREMSTAGFAFDGIDHRGAECFEKMTAMGVMQTVRFHREETPPTWSAAIYTPTHQLAAETDSAPAMEDILAWCSEQSKNTLAAVGFVQVDDGPHRVWARTIEREVFLIEYAAGRTEGPDHSRKWAATRIIDRVEIYKDEMNLVEAIAWCETRPSVSNVGGRPGESVLLLEGFDVRFYRGRPVWFKTGEGFTFFVETLACSLFASPFEPCWVGSSETLSPEMPVVETRGRLDEVLAWFRAISRR